MNSLYLGIDTSNYKTSVSIIDEFGNIVCNRSEYLDVALGERGLRQSDAFFMHSCRLPDYFTDIFRSIDTTAIKAVGVSSRPRRVEGSYMPCFLAGRNAALEIASALRIPLYEFSHQEGHIASVVSEEHKPFIFFHLSGGTTEFLVCREDPEGYQTEIAGGTEDISIGQLIDRIGVKMGYRFPAGSYLDDIAASAETSSSLIPRINIRDNRFNLSGIETSVIRTLETIPESDKPALISELFESISQLLAKSAISLSGQYDIAKVYIAGGVAASKTVRKRISDLAEGKNEYSTFPHVSQIIFGEVELSGDNAVGIARLARRIQENQ